MERDLGTESLIQESRDVGQRIHEIMLADEKMLATGVTILLGAAGFAAAQHKAHLLMLLPFGLFVLFCFVEAQHSSLMALGGYKSVLEEAIRTRSGMAVSGWESEVAPHLQRDIPIAMVRVCAVLLGIGSAAVAIYQARLTFDKGNWGYGDGTLYLVLTLASIVVGGVAVIAATWATTRQFQRVKDITREKLFDNWVGTLPSNLQ